MKPFLLLAALAITTTSCETLQYRVKTHEDPFTRARSRFMTVNESDASVFMNAMAAQNGQPRRALIMNHYMDITVTGQDTTLTLIKYFPDRAFDVPREANVQILFYEDRKNGASVIDLPLVGNYHTSNGSLIVTAKIDKTALSLLQRHVIDVIRIDRVSANESQFQPIDWYPQVQYAEQFQKGAVQLFNPKAGTPVVPLRTL
jgi:hypothetical protein